MKYRPLLILGILVFGLSLLYAVAPAQQRVLYEGKSPYTTIVVTENSRGLRTLWFEHNGVRQSVVKVDDPDYIELPYARVMQVGLALVDEPRQMLVVGLGGATIPRFLHLHYPQAVIDVVDIDPDVLMVARRFFGFREDRTLRAHVADGRKFIETSDRRYDIIFLDAYGPENIPYSLTTEQFLQAVRQHLSDKGVVVGNLFSSYTNELYDSMVCTYRQVFAEVYILDVWGAGNKIVLACPRQLRVRQPWLARRATRISRERKFPFDLGRIISYGFHDTRDDPLLGRVLRDKRPSSGEP